MKKTKLIKNASAIFIIGTLLFSSLGVASNLEQDSSAAEFIIEKYIHQLEKGSILYDSGRVQGVGVGSSLALDDNNYQHISYIDTGTGDLKCAHWTGTAWAIEIVDSNGEITGYTSIAVDKSGQPHISYYDSENMDLKYAYFSGSNWEIEIVDADGDVGMYPSIALDAKGNPHISYIDSSNEDLKYATKKLFSWDIETVDEDRVGSRTSIALDSNDYPHISYCNSGRSDLKYAYWTGSEWNIQNVETSGDFVFMTSIAVDSSDHPHICYFDITHNRLDLKYATLTGGEWDKETVDDDKHVGANSCITVDSMNQPHISYVDYWNGAVKYAFKQGESWSIEFVDTKGYVGGSNSIQLDSNNHPHISYLDEGNSDLKFAKWTGSNWDVEVVDRSKKMGQLDQVNVDGCGWGLQSPNYIAQSFVPTFNSLTYIEIFLSIWSNPCDSSLSIRSALDGEDLASDFLPAEEMKGGCWHNFDFEGLSLTPGETYYIIWNPESSGVLWMYSVDDKYTDGQAWYTVNDVWTIWENTDFQNCDFCFKTYGPNEGPSNPDISGPPSGKIGETYSYTFSATDPEEDDLMYLIDWGDGVYETVGPYQSSEEHTASHIWDTEGEYTLRIKSRDICFEESDWATLEVSMPKDKSTDYPIIFLFIEKLFQRFPLFEKILNQII